MDRKTHEPIDENMTIRARSLRRSITPFEAILWSKLRNRGLVGMPEIKKSTSNYLPKKKLGKQFKVLLNAVQ